jgi:dTMP kinase
MSARKAALIAFEGLDQSGKQTQAERLAQALRHARRPVEQLSFPDCTTSIGGEIGQALQGRRDYAPDTLQLLYVANRYEFRPRIEAWLAAGVVVICDRYLASSIAYGEAMGLDPVWLTEIQRHLPQPALTILLDIAPEASVARKEGGRDAFERDLALLSRVRASYRRQAEQTPGWMLLDGQRGKDEVSADVLSAVRTRLGLL